MDPSRNEASNYEQSNHSAVASQINESLPESEQPQTAEPLAYKLIQVENERTSTWPLFGRAKSTLIGFVRMLLFTGSAIASIVAIAVIVCANLANKLDIFIVFESIYLFILSVVGLCVSLNRSEQSAAIFGIISLFNSAVVTVVLTNSTGASRGSSIQYTDECDCTLASSGINCGLTNSDHCCKFCYADEESILGSLRDGSESTGYFLKGLLWSSVVLDLFLAALAFTLALCMERDTQLPVASPKSASASTSETIRSINLPIPPQLPPPQPPPPPTPPIEPQPRPDAPVDQAPVVQRRVHSKHPSRHHRKPSQKYKTNAIVAIPIVHTIHHSHHKRKRKTKKIDTIRDPIDRSHHKNQASTKPKRPHTNHSSKHRHPSQAIPLSTLPNVLLAVEPRTQETGNELGRKQAD